MCARVCLCVCVCVCVDVHGYTQSIVILAPYLLHCISTVAVNKKLSFRIRSTIIVRNEIHSFAAVAQYDKFAYFRVKVRC